MEKDTETALIVIGVLAGIFAMGCGLYRYCCRSSRVSYSVLAGSRVLRVKQNGAHLNIGASASVMAEVVRGNQTNVVQAAINALNTVDPHAKQESLAVPIDLKSPLLKPPRR